MAAERGEILLMAEDLVASEARSLEAFASPCPAAEKATAPGEADQAERDLDAARPVDARQERVRLPPGTKLRCYKLGVALVMRQEIRGSQQRDVLQPARLQEEFVIAGDRRVAGFDIEAVGPGGCEDSSVGIAKPVLCRLRQGDLAAEDVEAPGEKLIGRRRDRSAGLRLQPMPVPGDGWSGGGYCSPNGGWSALQSPPARLQALVAEPRCEFPRAHPAQPGDIPGDIHGAHSRVKT